MTKVNFQNLPNTSTPLNATNMNKIQELTYNKKAVCNTIGWYRIASIKNVEEDIGTPLSLFVTNSFGNNSPSVILANILTTYQKAKITQLNAYNRGEVGSETISKLRIQYNSSNDTFYIDCYYTTSQSNRIIVQNDNIIDTNYVSILVPTLVTTEYTTVDELTITY